MPITVAPVALCVALVALLPACGPKGAGSTSPDHAAGLQGNIDTRPFVARSGFARQRLRGGIDVYFYETALSVSEGCGESLVELAEAQRLVWVQMPWPVAEGAQGQGFEADEPNYWSTFFTVQRGHGNTSTRATGTITVERAEADAGMLRLDSATENEGDLHGSVRGAMAFSICSR